MARGIPEQKHNPSNRVFGELTSAASAVAFQLIRRGRIDDLELAGLLKRHADRARMYLADRQPGQRPGPRPPDDDGGVSVVVR